MAPTASTASPSIPGLTEITATFFLEQYGLEDIVEPGAGDIVVDCGAYRGRRRCGLLAELERAVESSPSSPRARNAEGLRANLAANRSISHGSCHRSCSSAVSMSEGVLDLQRTG